MLCMELLLLNHHMLITCTDLLDCSKQSLGEPSWEETGVHLSWSHAYTLCHQVGSQCPVAYGDKVGNGVKEVRGGGDYREFAHGGSESSSQSQIFWWHLEWGKRTRRGLPQNLNQQLFYHRHTYSFFPLKNVHGKTQVKSNVKKKRNFTYPFFNIYSTKIVIASCSENFTDVLFFL